MLSASWPSYAIAFLVTAMLCSFLRPLAHRIGLLDEPSLRKSHAGPVPLIGGLAMFAGLAFGALTLGVGLTPYRGYFAAAAVLVVVGILDDLHELTSRARFAAQIGAALVMAYWGGVVLEDLGGVRPDGGLFALGAWSIPVTVFATVGVINAVNMSDGLDGLAGSLTLVAVAGLLAVAGAGDRAGLVEMLMLLASVVAGYLCLNAPLPRRPQGLVFMGDAGSMLLGFSLAWFFVSMSQGEQRSMAPVTALWLLLVPLFDTVWLIMRRVVTGRFPTQADFEHLHHVLQMAGLGPGATVAVLGAVAVAGAAVGVAGHRLGWPEHVLFYGFLALFLAYCLVMAATWRRLRFLAWPIERRIGSGDRRRRERRAGAERRTADPRNDRRRRRGDAPPPEGG